MMEIKFPLRMNCEPDDLLGKPIRRNGKRIGTINCARVTEIGMEVIAEIQGKFSQEILNENVPLLIGCRP